MKKIHIMIFLLICSNILAQYELSAGMGLNFFSAPDLREYINSNFATSDEMASFNTSADFFAELGYNLNDDYQVSIEYTFNIFSFNSNFITGRYDLNISRHKPSLIAYYMYVGKGYKFKLGGGLGLRIADVEEDLLGTIKNYSTSGLGLLMKAQGDTKLGGNFYALISGEIRYDLPGEIETVTGSKFNINAFGVALKLGTIYYF